MKNKLIVLGSTLLCLITFISINQAQAVVPPDQAIINKVYLECDRIKVRLKQVQVNDALTRVNYGQIYESILSDLMTPISTRLVANSRYPSELIIIASDYQAELINFRRNYITYENTLAKLTNGMSCKKQPEEYYQLIKTLRLWRHKLNLNTRNLRIQAELYKNQFSEFDNAS